MKHDWTREEVAAIYHQPLLELVYRAATVHRQHHDPRQVQLCSLLSVRTGGCPEDCGYCPQARSPEVQPLLSVDEVVDAAQAAKARGSSRFCMGAAWRQVRDGSDFQQVLQMVQAVAALGMEACVTLGMLEPHQARALKEAGLTSYNHNLDTSPEFYGNVVTTRTYEDRLRTLEAVAAVGLKVCCGGIVGMGEGEHDRVRLLQQLACLRPHPESVPINALVRIAGTPLADRPPVDPLLVVRMVATARVLMPSARVRMSAGRREMHETAQALCFLAGANSIFVGERLLTAPNQDRDEDDAMLARLGLQEI